MKYSLHLYHIDKKYIRDLHNVDDKVMSVSPQIHKDTRPFVGIVVLLNERKYCIPLTSPNKDMFQGKSKVDFIKILDPSVKDKNGKEKTIGILNINNMIPVDESVIQKIDLTLHKTDQQDVRRRKSLMIDQLDWCRNNYTTIENRANKVYALVTETPEKNRNLVRRCCNFKRLEAVLNKYISKGSTLNSEVDSSSRSTPTRSQEPFFIGRKAILGHKPSAKKQEPQRSQERKKSNHHNNNLE